MPIYEYQCRACGIQEEKLEVLTAQDFHACPTCGAPEGMKRLLSVASVSTSSHIEGRYESSPSCSGGSCPFVRG